MSDAKSWIVTMSGDRPVEDVARDVVRSGLVVSGILDAVGVITGSASDKVAANLRKIRGVADVSPDVPMDLGPPDSGRTW